MDWFMEKAVRASFWMIGAWGVWGCWALAIGAADRIDRAIQEANCEAPRAVMVVYQHDTKGQLHRRRECREPAVDAIRVVRNADGQLVRAK